MRDRDAERLARDTAGYLTNILGILPAVRAKLHQWQSAGFPAGIGESSIGSDRISDPTSRAVQAAEILEPAKPGQPSNRRRRLGWRPVDEEGEQIRRIDEKLADIHKRARDFYDELARLNAVYDGPGEPGCVLCDVILPINAKTRQAEHRCDPDCAKRGHRHALAHQRIYSRNPPKPPADDREPVAPLARCSWHYDFAERYGVDAGPELTIWHLDHLGERIPAHLVRQHHPAQYRLYHQADA